MSDFTITPADTLAPADLHAATIAAFADYLIGPFRMTLAEWPSFVGRQAADLAASRAAVRDGRVLAFALVARRPDVGRWRLAVMGALPEARGTGAAPALLDDYVARGRAAGLRAVELECFAQNERALRLYRGRGFEAVQAMHGWTHPADPALADAPTAASPENAPRTVDRETAFAWLAEAVLRIADLPLQVTPPSLAAAVRPLSFWQIGSAQLVFSVVEGTPIQVHSLIDRDPAQRDAQALVQALRRAHPGRVVHVPPLQRDDLGGEALRRDGFVPMGMGQVLMVRRLA